MRCVVTESCIQRSCENLDNDSWGLYCMAEECGFSHPSNKDEEVDNNTHCGNQINKV